MSKQTWYRAAICCAVIPLALGVTIFSGWLLTRWDFLMLFGFMNLALGVTLFFVGGFCLWRFAVKARNDAEETSQSIRRKAWKAASLLLVNFPVAISIMFIANRIESAFSVTVVNESSKPIEQVRIQGPGDARFIEKLQPGEKKKQNLWFSGDGTLELIAKTDGREIHQEVEGYVTGSQGGATTVIFQPDGSVRIAATHR